MSESPNQSSEETRSLGAIVRHEWRRIPYAKYLPAALGGAASMFFAIGAVIGLQGEPTQALTPASVKTIESQKNLVPVFRLIEDAQAFAPEATSIQELIHSNALVSVPERLESLQGQIRLTPTAVVADGIDTTTCRYQSRTGTTPADQGVSGFQCLVDESNDKPTYQLVYRSSPIPASDRGFWKWTASRDASGAAIRLSLAGETDLLETCEGKTPTHAQENVISRTQTWCIPAFRGEPETLEHWGPYYANDDREKSFSITAGGETYDFRILP